MILRKTSVLGAILIAVRKGKKVSHVNTMDTDKMTIRDIMGNAYQVDYFVAYKPPQYLKGKLKQLGIEWTRDVNSYIEAKNHILNKMRRQRKRKRKNDDKKEAA